MTNFGIKIAKPGFDVKTAGYKDLLFHSSYPLLKIKISGTGSITPTIGGSTIVTAYTHSLGYNPLFDFFTQWYDPSTGTKQTTYRRVSITDQIASGFNLYVAYVDTTKLYFRIDANVGSGVSLDYKYYLYYDPIP